MRVDSHHHFWNYSPQQYGWISDDKAVLRKDFGPQELQAVCKPVGVEGVVSVQARQTIEETEWLLEIAAKNDFVLGVVGWVPLARESIASDLERLSANPLLKGVRHVVQDEPDDDFILGTEFGRGIDRLKEFGLVYDILIYAKHLTASTKFVDRHPEQKFVLDHIAKPTIRRNQFDQEWAQQIGELARRDNVTCKFSGVATEVRDDDWELSTVQPYWDVVLEAFGPSRLMFGSDWPVCLLKTEYRRWAETVEQLMGSLTEREQQQIWSETAIRAYGLSSTS